MAYPIAIGLAALAAIGGWLNVLYLAYPPTMWVLLAIGWIAMFKNCRLRRFAKWKDACNGTTLISAGVILAIGLFLGITLLPGGAFNPWDDLVMYFPRSTRMLQTGTFGHDPFSPLGLDSLGSQAFLQAFTLLVSGPDFLHSFDAVFCAVLALCLIVEIGKSLDIHQTLIWSAIATAILIHPAQVNISSVYSTTSLSLAIVPAMAELLPSEGSPIRASWRSAIPLALLCAAIASLKTTTWFFLIASGFLLLLLVAVDRGPRLSARNASLAIGLSFVFVFPWIALSGDKFSRMLGKDSAQSFLGVVGNPADLLGGDALLWGGTPLAYTAIAVFTFLVAGIAAGMCLGRKKANVRYNAVTVPLIALCGGCAIAYMLNIIPFDVRYNVRYSAPMLIVGAACAVLVGGHLLSGADSPRGRKNSEVGGLRLLLFACAIPLATLTLFAATVKDRIWNAITYRSALSFPQRNLDGYAMYSALALRPEARFSVIRAQAQTAPGQQILAVISQPYHLLFARNPIFLTMEFGMAWPWLDLPINAGAVELGRFLHRYGIRYVIWEKKGPAIGREEDLTPVLNDTIPLLRESARAALSFHRSMLALEAESKVIYREQDIVVLDVGTSPDGVKSLEGR